METRAELIAVWQRLRPRWVLVLFGLLFVVGTVRFFAARRPDGTPEARIGVDGRYYWAYLTSLVLDRDLDFENQYANPDSGNYYGYGRTNTGRLANPFTVGPALMWMPFFLVAHGAAMVVKPERWEDGTSYLHQLVTLYGSFLFVFAAGVLAYLAAQRRFGPGPAVAGAVVAVTCGSLLQYTFNQPHYSHAPSAFAVTAMLYVWDRGRGGERSFRGWLGLGALVGLAILVKAQNIVFAIPVVVEGAARLVRAIRARDLRSAAAPVAAAGVALLVFTPQLIVWKILYGGFFVVPQGEAYMRWGASLWADTLFSSRNGLFPYAPLWAIAILGLVGVWRVDRTLAATLVGTFLLVAYVNGAASDHSGGGAFGGRRYDGLLLHVTLGFAAVARAVIDLVERRPRVAAGAAVTALVLYGVTCNTVMSEDYRGRRLHPSQSKDTFAWYQRIAQDLGRGLWRAGNPLSWPGAWAFALRTGAPPSRYDEVVGNHFLTDFELESFRTRRQDKLTDELRFADKGQQKFLLGVDAKGEVARSARALIPLNITHGVELKLIGRAAAPTTVRLSWNGEEVARAEVAPGSFELPATLPAGQVGRGVNLLDVDVTTPVTVDKLALRQTAP